MKLMILPGLVVLFAAKTHQNTQRRGVFLAPQGVGQSLSSYIRGVDITQG